MSDAAAGDPPALILGGPWVWPLSMIRSLGRHGVPLFSTGTAASFVAASRWHRAAPRAWGEDPTPETLAPYLAALPVGRMVVIPSTDEWALGVARLPRELAARFPSSLPPLDSLEILTDKGRFAATLAELGVPHPRTVCVGPGGDWSRIPDEAFANAFLKPRNSQAFRRRFGLKALRFGSRAEATALADDAREASLEVMLQEYVPGPPTGHYMVEGFVDRAGRVRARFVRQRLRMFPPDFGDSTCMVGVPVDRVRRAVEHLDRLLAHLSYRGVFEAEFKHDERDGEFKLLEVNARPWGFIGFADACGVDFCGMAYRDALGHTVEAVTTYQVGRRCVVGADRFACWRELRAGRLTPWASLRSWLGARQLLFAWDDPLPGFARLLLHLWIVARRALARIAGRTGQTSQE